MNWRKSVSFSIFAAAVLFAQACSAQEFSGKTLNIYHGYGTGGTYDFYARLFARHLPRFLPGSPTAIVQSMPGAGGLRMMDFAASQMAKDGTQILIPPDTSAISQLLEKAPRFDLRKFGYIGIANSETVLWVVRTEAARSIADVKAKEITSGSSGPGSSGSIVPGFAKALIGAKVKIVSGYQGSRQTILAMERKEVDGAAFGWGTWETAVPQWFEKGREYAIPILQVGASADAQFPNVPMMHDLVGPKDKPLVGIINTMSAIGRSLALPPGTPRPVLDVYRKAFAAMIADREFRADAEKQKLRILPAPPEDLERLIESVFSTSTPEVIERARTLAEMN